MNLYSIYFISLSLGLSFICLLLLKDKKPSTNQVNLPTAKAEKSFFKSQEKPKIEKNKTPEEISKDNVDSELNLQNKYKKLEELFQEKSDAVLRLQKALDNELSHRGEFATVKALLDSQIIHLKEKIHGLEIDLQKNQRQNSSKASPETSLETS